MIMKLADEEVLLNTCEISIYAKYSNGINSIKVFVNYSFFNLLPIYRFFISANNNFQMFDILTFFFSFPP